MVIVREEEDDDEEGGRERGEGESPCSSSERREPRPPRSVTVSEASRRVEKALMR